MVLLFQIKAGFEILKVKTLFISVHLPVSVLSFLYYQIKIVDYE